MDSVILSYCIFKVKRNKGYTNVSNIMNLYISIILYQSPNKFSPRLFTLYIVIGIVYIKSLVTMQ